MPQTPSLPHTALGTGTDCGTKLRGRLYGWLESTKCLTGVWLWNG